MCVITHWIWNMGVLATNECTLCAYQCYVPPPPLVGATWGIWTSKISVAQSPKAASENHIETNPQCCWSSWNTLKVKDKGKDRLLLWYLSFGYEQCKLFHFECVSQIWKLACNILNKSSGWRCVLQFLQIQAIRHKHRILFLKPSCLPILPLLHVILTATRGTREHAQANNLNWVMI